MGCEEETQGSTISSRTSDELMNEDPKTNATDITGLAWKSFSRSEKTAKIGGLFPVTTTNNSS
jgi:hypothetical protein